MEMELEFTLTVETQLSVETPSTVTTGKVFTLMVEMLLFQITTSTVTAITHNMVTVSGSMVVMQQSQAITSTTTLKMESM